VVYRRLVAGDQARKSRMTAFDRWRHRNRPAWRAVAGWSTRMDGFRYMLSESFMEKDLRKKVLLRLFFPSDSDRPVFRESVRVRRPR
jgi:hypothetical protein